MGVGAIRGVVDGCSGGCVRDRHGLRRGKRSAAGVIAGMAALCGGGWFCICEEAVLLATNSREYQRCHQQHGGDAGQPAWRCGATGFSSATSKREAAARQRTQTGSLVAGAGCRTAGRGSPGRRPPAKETTWRSMTVKGTVAPLTTVTLAGTVHWAPKGTPEHVKVIVP